MPEPRNGFIHVCFFPFTRYSAALFPLKYKLKRRQLDSISRRAKCLWKCQVGGRFQWKQCSTIQCEVKKTYMNKTISRFGHNFLSF